MRIEQRIWNAKDGWVPKITHNHNEKFNLLLVFGAKERLVNKKLLREISESYPNAEIFGCSTAGEIIGAQVLDNSIILTAVEFRHTQIKSASVRINQVINSYQAGEHLAVQLPESIQDSKSRIEHRLVHVLVISDGLKVNGSDLVKGLTSKLPQNVTITGGLAGDAEQFEETVVFANGKPQSGMISVVGLYGNRLKVGFSSQGGWDPFGPERLITRSTGNVLYELDGYSALELYKKYLGEHAKELPASALLFPLSVRTKSDEAPVTRTILSIDEKEKSMIFAGDVPEGSYARFMKANFNRLIDGAIAAARNSMIIGKSKNPKLAILISCIGRKLVLKQRIEEEVEGVQDSLGGETKIAGFYSYGEIAPFKGGTKCELHNQSMTITLLLEE